MHPSPDAYFYALPAPGHRFATGSWTSTEEALFAQRIQEFRIKNWPLSSYWGIFSLFIPNRTGSQCQHHYRHSPHHPHYHETDAASVTLAISQSILLHHRHQINEIWNSDLSREIEKRVSLWLSATVPVPVPVPVPMPSSMATTERLVPPVLHTHSEKNLLRPDFPPPPIPAATAMENIDPTTVGAPLPISSHAKRKKKKKETISDEPKKMKKGTAGLPLGPLSVPHHHNTNTTPNTLRRPLGDTDSDDEFVQNTNAPVRKKARLPPSSLLVPPPPPPPMTTSMSMSKGVKKHKKRALVRSISSSKVFTIKMNDSSTSGDQARHDAGQQHAHITTIRLDKDRASWPGWNPRAVKSYDPVLDFRQNTTATSSSVITTPCILSFDFSSLTTPHHPNDKFTGVIINAPLSDDPRTGVTCLQLASMSLRDCLAPDAIVCVWASKGLVGQAVGCLSQGWGCKYVENLTWVHVDANHQVLVAPTSSSLFSSSHSTLVMGRKGGGKDLELRHQRSPDVILEPVMDGGRFPDGVREMMELLLPPPAATKSAGRRRFLEVAFHGAEPGERDGWVKLVLQSS